MNKSFLVTVKLPKNPDHNPRNKITGPCPVDWGKQCSDSTGEHHTVLFNGPSITAVSTYWREVRCLHVTRIEEV